MRVSSASIPALAGLLLAATATVVFAAGTTERVSVGSDEEQADRYSTEVSLSADGRFVAFVSPATNLVPGGTSPSGLEDAVFVRDRRAGTTELVSVGLGDIADGESFSPSISADSRFVAFGSLASNLVPDDTNLQGDVFVRDRQAGTTERVSLGPGGAQGEGFSFRPSISADGRYVAFFSTASNLVPDDTNGVLDVFVRDRVTGRTERVSLGPKGRQANGGTNIQFVAISAKGRFVAFVSEATNLVRRDTNGALDVFVRDRVTGRTERVSVATGGGQADGVSAFPSISAGGRYVAFASTATNLVPRDTNGVPDIFVHDRVTGRTERVSVGPKGRQANSAGPPPGGSFGTSISGNGRHVAFVSVATNLVPGDTNDVGDVFVRDRRTGETRRVSVPADGGQSNGHSGFFRDSLAISADGRVVAFGSEATNLVPGDTNDWTDIFVRVPAAGG